MHKNNKYWKIIAAYFQNFTRKISGTAQPHFDEFTTVEVLDLNFPACIRQQHPQVFLPAWTAIEEILALVKDADLSSLARHSPGLMGFKWEVYLRCSVVRMVRVLAALSQYNTTSKRLLDFGAYFGNFSLMCANQGYQVDAIDSYSSYGQAFSSLKPVLQNFGVRMLDFEETGYALNDIETETYDIVLCMGVAEHIPHTPRFLLEAIDRVLKPGGLLVMDTPNLAYLPKRQSLMRGESIFPSIASQYYVDPPFEGHHREYTLAEMEWMLQQIKHTDISIDTFNFSIYGTEMLQGDALKNYKFMEKNPEYRELIMTISRKPVTR